MQNRRGMMITTWLIGLLIVVTGVGGGLMFALTDSPVGPTSMPRVEYRLLGDAEQVEVDFLNDSGMRETRQATARNATFRFRGLPDQPLSFVVKRTGGSGSVGCQIKVDGRDLVVVPADAGQSEARCEGRVP